MVNREYRCRLVVEVSLQHLLLVEVPPQLPRLRRKRRKRRSAYLCFYLVTLSDITSRVQEESDDDMGFGLFD
jgi:hypothetical protein